MKNCPKCGEQKPLSEFHKNKNKPTGLSSHCKLCAKHTAREWRIKNPQYQKKYHFKLKYGITLEERSSLLKLQGNKCAICDTDIQEEGKYHVDHCHRTNSIRGVLCPNCNIMLGHAKDSTEILKSALNYLEKYNSKSDKK
jgi:hypothetical protein